MSVRRAKICAVIFLVSYIMPVSSKCKTEEVEMCLSTNPPKGCLCEPCISCAKGYGPSHQCGGRYLNGTVISCKRCVRGKNYSEVYSVASCQPCPQCGGRKTLRKCKPKRKTRCSTECRAGYVWSIVMDDCMLDTASKTTPQQIDTSKLTTTPDLPKSTATRKTTKKATTTDLSKTTTISNTTTKNTTADLPKSTAIPKTTTNTTTLLQVRNTQKKATTAFHPDIIGRERESKSKDYQNPRHDRIILIMVSVICSIMGTALLAFLAYHLYKKSLHRNDQVARDRGEKMPLTSFKESPRTSQENIEHPWPNDCHLKDITNDLRSDIAALISESSVLKSWRAIGEELGLCQLSLVKIDNAGRKKDADHGLELFKVLAANKPELTLTEFVKTLEKLKRNDVCEIIRHHYQKVNTDVHVMQREGLQNDQQPDNF